MPFAISSGLACSREMGCQRDREARRRGWVSRQACGAAVAMYYMYCLSAGGIYCLL